MGEFYCKVSSHTEMVKIEQRPAFAVHIYMGQYKHLDRNSNTVWSKSWGREEGGRKQTFHVQCTISDSLTVPKIEGRVRKFLRPATSTQVFFLVSLCP